jgi:hypothetical protein
MRFTPLDVYQLQQPDDACRARKAVGGSKMKKAKLIVALAVLAMGSLAFAPAAYAQCPSSSRALRTERSRGRGQAPTTP